MKVVCKCGKKFDDESKNIKTIMHKCSNGTDHKRALCPACGTEQWRALPQGKPIDVFYFGKYKGRQIMEIVKEDVNYCKWLLSQNIKDKLKLTIDEALHDRYNAVD